MNWWHAVLLGVVEGITEFLPVSSTGHLTITQGLLGYDIDDPGVTAFTAVIQIGAIAAAVLYFAADIRRIATTWARGLVRPEVRQESDYRLGWGVILGSLPAAAVGLGLRDLIEGPLRNLWLVAAALVLWSGVLWAADRVRSHGRTMVQVTVRDALVVGLFQSLAPLFAGISRSGATISAGLFLGLDRVAATRLSFYMGIPVLVAAAGLQLTTAWAHIGASIGWTATLTATGVSFVVAYAAIAWLLAFIARNTFTAFIVYRVVVGLGLMGLLLGGVVQA